MNKASTFLLWVFIGFAFWLPAQDTHFSQFYASPLNLNPALTGVNQGTYRLAGIYRNQDRSFTVPYVTYSVSGDSKILENKLKSDILGVGLVFLGDKSGDGVLTMNNIMLSVAYHKSLDKAHKHYIGLGIQGGYTMKSVNINRLTFPDQHVGSDFDLSAPNGENLAKSQLGYFDLNIGILHQSWIKKDDLGIFSGFSIYHLTSPKESFYNDGTHLANRFTFHAGAYIKVIKHFYVTPNILVNYQNKALEVNFGTGLEYHLDTKKSPLIMFVGGWGRVGDVGIVSAGLEYYKVRVSFAYDITASSLSDATNKRSAFELAVIFTGLIKSPKEVTYPRMVPCPLM